MPTCGVEDSPADIGDRKVSALDISLLQHDDVFHRLQTSLSGLSSNEASKRLIRHGQNSINVVRPKIGWRLFCENFLHTMALLLWCAGIIAFAAGMPQLGTAIWLVNIVNGSFGLWQEYHAEKATQALKDLLPSFVNVLRDQQVVSIGANMLVPGDVVFLEAGDKVSADIRLCSSESLELDQSTLTGESHTAKKHASLTANGASQTSGFDASNLVFAGTSVLAGSGVGVVYSTGVGTEFGKVAHLTQTIQDQPSPLQKEMARVTKIVSLIAVSVGVAMFCIAILFAHIQPSVAFMFSMGMIVAFVPEGMLPTVTLSLALAVQRMAKRNALVKRLSSVEALGCTSVICTDKTGTLTCNEMSVARVYLAEQDFCFVKGTVALASSASSNTEKDGAPCDSIRLSELFRAFALCNNARETSTPLSFIGDPTEVALLEAAFSVGCSRFREEQEFRRIFELPFDSRRKMMLTVHESVNGKIAFMKGAPHVVVERCASIRTELGNEILTDERRKHISEQVDLYAREGLRVLAAATKQIHGDARSCEASTEHEFTFLGLVGMFDPPRPGVLESVQKCHNSGIQIVMVTGDYEVTAEAIARKTGILAADAQSLVITGACVDRMTDQELTEHIVERNVIFARVNPEHKLRVVQAFQRCGEIVAVTGDGVNDAPALKKADIGIAMGKSGTDVAKEAADIILLDDNFASIVSAVEEGRAVYDNIKKFALYVLNSNMAEAVPFALMLLTCGLIPLPLTVMQVLSIDLGTDMIPAIALGADPASKEVMNRLPRKLDKPLLCSELLLKAFFWYGAIEAFAGLSGYFYGNYVLGWPAHPLAEVGSAGWRFATSMTLSCIVVAQVGAVFCCRNDHDSVFQQKLSDNPLILAGVLFELALLAVILYVPAAQSVFDTASLATGDICFALCWAPIMVALDELRKHLLRRFR